MAVDTAFATLDLGRRHSAAGGILLMVVGGAANTTIPLLLGKLVDTVQTAPGAKTPARDVAENDVAENDTPANNRPKPAMATGASGPMRTLAFYLALIGGAYLIRETVQVGRRILVEYTCAHLEKHLFVRLVSHSLMTDLTALSKEKIGTLHGRMLRNIAGSVRFFRVGFLDFLPALVAGCFALTAVFVKGPWVGLAMIAVIPLSIFVTLKQLLSQKGVRHPWYP